MKWELTQCIIEGCYFKFDKQTSVNSYTAKCQRCGKVVRVYDETFFKRANGEYKL